MSSLSQRQNPFRELWLNQIFWRAWIVQGIFAFSIPLLTMFAAPLLYKLIPHRGNPHLGGFFRGVHATGGGEPEDTAPLGLSVGLYFCNVFAVVNVVFNFVQVFVLKCCCSGGLLNPITYAIFNILLCWMWVFCSGLVGGVFWEYESYLGIHLLEEPIWWAAFALQVAYGLAFVVPALASIRYAFRGLLSGVIRSEERRHLIFVVENRNENDRSNEAPPNYGTSLV